MKIKLLDIKGFGKLTGKRIVPGEGFNIVIGPNEAGKSTLVAFIKAMLFGLGNGRRKGKDLAPAKRYMPWNGNAFAGILEYETMNGETYRIGRNFDKGSVQIHDGKINNITSQFPLDREEGPRFAQAHLGLDEALFEKTAFMGQLQSAVDEDGRRRILERISNMSTTGSEEQSLAKAIEALETANLEQVGTGRSSTRPLDQVNGRIKQLERRKKEVSEQLEKHLKSWATLKEHRAKVAEWKDQYEQLEKERNSLKKNRLLQLKSEMEDLERHLRKNADRREILQMRQWELARFSTATEATAEEIQTLWFELCEIEKNKKTLEDEIEALKAQVAESASRLAEQQKPAFEAEGEEAEDAEVDKARESATNGAGEAARENVDASAGELAAKAARPVKKANPRSMMLPLSVLFLILSGLCLAAWRFWPQAPLKAQLGYLAPVFLILCVMFLLLGQKKKDNPMALEWKRLQEMGFTSLDGYLRHKEDYLELAYTVETQKQTLEDYLNRKKDYVLRQNEILEILGNRTGQPGASREELGARVRTFKALLLEYRGIQNQLTVLESSIKTTQDRMGFVLWEASSLVGRKLETMEALAEVCAAIGDPAGLLTLPDEAALDETLKSLSQSIRSSEIIIKECETRLENEPDEGVLAQIDEEISQLDVKREELEGIGLSIREAMECLQSVAQDMQKGYMPELNREMNRMAGTITGHEGMRVTANDALQIQLEVPECEEIIPLGLASSGTIDQVYLSMRLASVSLLEKDKERLPLFLDEPFAQYDEDRAARALELIRDFAASRQVFLFTCREREVELAARIFGEAMQIIRLN